MALCAQELASGIGWGIAAGRSPATIAFLLAAALAAAVAAALFLSARAGHAQDPLLAARSLTRDQGPPFGHRAPRGGTKVIRMERLTASRSARRSDDRLLPTSAEVPQMIRTGSLAPRAAPQEG